MRNTTALGMPVQAAETCWERMRGLIGRPPPAVGTGFLIPHCNAIHTCFMSYAIDATFLDRAGRAVKTVRGIRPWRFWVWGGWRAVAVVETAASAI